MFRFAYPEYLIYLLIVPVAIILFVISRYRKKRAIKKFGDLPVISQLMTEVSSSRPVWKFIFVIVSITLILITIARPQFGSQLKEIKRKGIEIIIALDVSNSMLAEDIKPNRLENAKLAISKLVERLRDDKIGLIVFGGDAYVQIPITTDYDATEMFLNSINTGIIPKQGTAIGSAIELGMKSFTPDNEKSKVLVIITDGENHEDNAVEAARNAAEKNVVVHTIGMGRPEGSPIPAKGSNDFMKDRSGSVIVSKLNVSMLQQIAKAGNGMYVQASNTSSALKTLFSEINKMEEQEMEAKVYSDYDEKFQYIAAFALLFLFIDFIVLERKNRMLRNVNLFKNNFKT